MEVGVQVLHPPGKVWGRLRTNIFSSCKQQSWGCCFAQVPASEVPWDATARLGSEGHVSGVFGGRCRCLYLYWQCFFLFVVLVTFSCFEASILMLKNCRDMCAI